jgi:hypothetical protein
MGLKQAALATLIATIWGIAFVVSKIGLTHFSPAQLTTLQFVVASVVQTQVLFSAAWSAPWQLFGMGLLLTGVAAVAMSRNSSRKNCGRTFNLARHQVFNVGDVSGCAISTVSGELWITLGGPRDFLLPVGESMCIKRPDEVVVNAVQDSMFKIHAIQ